MNAQQALPLPVPAASNIVVINARCSLRIEADQRVVAGLPVHHYRAEDVVAEAYAMVFLVESGFAQQTEVARAFARSVRSVRRYQRRYAQGGMAALGRVEGWRRGRRRVAGKRLRSIETLKSQGLSNRAIAHRLARISHPTECIGAANQRKLLCENDFQRSRSAPMRTECNADLFGFTPVAGREVVAAFDGGAITSDAGALLLGAAAAATGLIDRFAGCFHDARRAKLIEHEVATLVGQRVYGIALGYEDLNDHDQLRHDPMMAVLAGKLEARREDCAPVAGKSTLNRLELSQLEPTRYHKISHNPIAIKRLFVDQFLEAHERAPSQIILDLDATDDPVHGNQEGRFFHGYYDCYCYLPLY